MRVRARAQASHYTLEKGRSVTSVTRLEKPGA
jgi:hypothetical protein